MKILLFNPYCSFDNTAYVFYRANIPYGLLYIAGYLKKHGIDCKIYELGIFNEGDSIKFGNRTRLGVSNARICEIIFEENPDIIGLSTMYTVFHKDYVEIIDTIKRFSPKTRVVVGGNHASVFPDKMLEAGADQVVVGEGERAFLGIAVGTDKDKIVKRPFIEDLDELPFLPLDMIDYKKYMAVSNPFAMRTPVAGIMSSRGCPHDCVYCTANGVWQRKWRARSAENVVAEMEQMIVRYGIKEFHFLDDNIGVDKERLNGICYLIYKRGLNIKWALPNGIAHWNLDHQLLDRMKLAGCYRLTFGIESGDPETRKFIGKTFDLAQARDIINYANKIGMWTITTNILGFPYEDWSAAANTIQFAKDCGTDFSTFFLLLPHPSSKVYQYFIRENLFDAEDSMSILNEGGCDTKYFKKEELKDIQKKAYHSFVQYKFWQYLKHPGLILRKINSWEDLCYVIRLVRLGLAMKFRKGMVTTKDFVYGKRQYV